MTWQPLNPYQGEEPPPLTGEDLAFEVAYLKRVCDSNGEPYDPAWDEALRNDGMRDRTPH